MQRLYICQIKYTANEVVYILYKGYILIDGSFEIDFYLITCLVFSIIYSRYQGQSYIQSSGSGCIHIKIKIQW
jgi:hypothetical protein